MHACHGMPATDQDAQCRVLSVRSRDRAEETQAQALAPNMGAWGQHHEDVIADVAGNRDGRAPRGEIDAAGKAG
jgi:hypothetical protein